MSFAARQTARVVQRRMETEAEHSLRGGGKEEPAIKRLVLVLILSLIAAAITGPAAGSGARAQEQPAGGSITYPAGIDSPAAQRACDLIVFAAGTADEEISVLWGTAMEDLTGWEDVVTENLIIAAGQWYNCQAAAIQRLPSEPDPTDVEALRLALCVCHTFFINQIDTLENTASQNWFTPFLDAFERDAQSAVERTMKPLEDVTLHPDLSIDEGPILYQAKKDFEKALSLKIFNLRNDYEFDVFRDLFRESRETVEGAREGSRCPSVPRISSGIPDGCWPGAG